ncbi:MAG: hypothetical protein RR466_01420 [Hungatella sp.]
MTNKKNKFFTFCFSMIPGAGEMYLGFYKMGISLMTIFGIIIALVGVFELGIFFCLLPVLWFYSFFHVHNLNSLPEEEFYTLEDDWIFSSDFDQISLNSWVLKHKKSIAVVLILFGVSILWKIFYNFLFSLMGMIQLSDQMRNLFYQFSSALPQGVLAVLIILFGIYLIKGKKEELNREPDSIIPEPPYPEPPYLDVQENKDPAE